MIDLAPKQRRCKLCREVGHRRDRCPKQPAAVAEILDVDPIGQAAGVRMRIDALRASIKENERIRSHVEELLAHDRAALAKAQDELAGLRRARRAA